MEQTPVMAPAPAPSKDYGLIAIIALVVIIIAGFLYRSSTTQTAQPAETSKQETLPPISVSPQPETPDTTLLPEPDGKGITQ